MINCLCTHHGVSSKAVCGLVNCKKDGFRMPYHNPIPTSKFSLRESLVRRGLKHADDNKVQIL